MKKILTIAKWEFLERVKRKSFLLSIIIMPLLIVAFTIIPSQLFTEQRDFPLAIGILDFSEKFGKDLTIELANYHLDNGQPEFIVLPIISFSEQNFIRIKKADDYVLENRIQGYIIIDEEDKITFRTNDIINFEKINKIENAYNKVYLKYNADNYGISSPRLEMLIDQFSPIKKSFIKGKSEEDILKLFLNSYFLNILLIALVLFSGGMFVRSLVVEKSNRIIELLLSSCSSQQLLSGKVLGLSMFGLFQFIAWMAIGTFLNNTNVIDFSSVSNLPIQLLFFTLGYIFYSAIFIGLGSVVTLDSEAQQLTGYLSMFLIFPVVIAFEIITSPNSVLALVLSYFPLTSAPVMLLRLNSTNPELQEIVSIIFVLVFSIYLVVYFSSRLFKTGVLNSEKRPTISQIISWIRAK